MSNFEGPLTLDRMIEALAQELPKYVVDPSERTVSKLFYRDDMENYSPVRWTPGDATTTLTYVLTDPGAVGLHAFEGDYMLQALDATLTRKSIIAPRFGPFKPQKIGVELRWIKRAQTRYIQLYAFNANGANPTDVRWQGLQWRQSGRSDGKSGWLYPLGPIGAWSWADVGKAVEYIESNTWNYLKLVFDLQNQRLDRLITNYLDLDLSGLKLAMRKQVAGHWSVTGEGYFRVYIYLSSEVVNYAEFIDDFRIYLNEV